MIVRVSNRLVDQVRGTVEPVVREPRSPVRAWDGTRLITPPTIQSHGLGGSDPEEVAGLLPGWLKDALAEGSVVVMGDDDFYSLDHEVRMEMEVIKR